MLREIYRNKLGYNSKMAMQSYDCRCIALAQLETALRLYFERADYFSVIALAGNADEVFGKVLMFKGIKNSLDQLKKSVSDIHRHLFGEELPASVVADLANRARNVIKHGIGEVPIVTFDAEEEARDLLNRAIDNYWTLEKWLTPAMEQFHRESIVVG
jgi:hypothetical protein